MSTIIGNLLGADSTIAAPACCARTGNDLLVCTEVPMRVTLLLLTGLLGARTPTRSTIGGYTPEQVAQAVREARAHCVLKRGETNLPPYPFTTDGCSTFPDGAWKSCCVTHDYAYWCGGTAED